jgi:hypothetical protein
VQPSDLSGVLLHIQYYLYILGASSSRLEYSQQSGQGMTDGKKNRNKGGGGEDK